MPNPVVERSLKQVDWMTLLVLTRLKKGEKPVMGKGLDLVVVEALKCVGCGAAGS